MTYLLAHLASEKKLVTLAADTRITTTQGDITISTDGLKKIVKISDRCYVAGCGNLMQIQDVLTSIGYYENPVDFLFALQEYHKANYLRYEKSKARFIVIGVMDVPFICKVDFDADLNLVKWDGNRTFTYSSQNDVSELAIDKFIEDITRVGITEATKLCFEYVSSVDDTVSGEINIITLTQ